MSLLIRRGEIWLVEFSPTRGREQFGARPALILTADSADLNVLELVQVVPGTKNPRPTPTHIRADPSTTNGLDLVTFFMCEQLRTVSTDRLKRRLGKASAENIEEVEECIKMLLDLT